MNAHLITKEAHDFPKETSRFDYYGVRLKITLSDLTEDDATGNITARGSYIYIDGGQERSVQSFTQVFPPSAYNAMIASMIAQGGLVPDSPESDRRAAIRLQGLKMYVQSNPIKTRSGVLSLNDFE